MNKLLLIITLLLVSCTQIPPVTPNVSSVPEESSVVLIRTRYNNDNMPRYKAGCGGVIVGKHLIITADHCVGEVNSDVYFVTRDLWYTTTDDKEAAKVISKNEINNTAYLYSKKELGPVATIRSPQSGEFKLVVRKFQVTPDYASQVGKLGIELHKHDSGSGVFSQDGELFGVITGCPAKEEYTVNNRGPCLPGGYYDIP